MKKSLSCLGLLLILCLTSCGKESAPVSIEQVQPDQVKGEAVPDSEPEVILPEEMMAEEVMPKEAHSFTQDTYWIAYRWFSNETDETTDFSLPTDIWWIDLLIRADGTAQLRDVHDEVYMTDEDTMYMTWELRTEDEIYFYNELYAEPMIAGVLEGDSLHLQYRGFELYMKQEEKPETAGEWFIPAELAGTWLMVSGLTEGWEWEAMPGHFETLVFSFMWDEYGPGLRADSQYCYGDEMEAVYWKNVVTVLEEPLYEGCGNETWSVRIGEESPRDENGYLTGTEYYATLLDHSTLLLQQYYTMDGYPALSYQTFRRFPGHNSGWDVYDFDVVDSAWVCTGYTTEDGEELPVPPGMKDMIISLMEENNTCQIGIIREGEEYFSYMEGRWQMGNGGSLLLKSDEYGGLEGEGFWYGGAVGGYFTKEENQEEYSPDHYEMELYDQGGIIHFTRVEAFG